MTTIQDVNIVLMLNRLRPSSSYLWARDGSNPNVDLGNTMASILEWRDGNTSQPTEAEVITEWGVYLAEQAQEATDLQADNTDLAGAAATLLQALINDITTERAAIAARKTALQTALSTLPASLNGTQAANAVTLLANADIDIATALDNIDARQLKFARALAVLVKRSV